MPALYAHHFGGCSKMHYKKLFTHVGSHASSESARERRITLYQSDQQQQQQQNMNTSERWRVSSAVTPSTLLRYLEPAASASTPWMEYCGTNLVVKTPVACVEFWEQHCRRFLHQISNSVWKQNSKSSADLQVKQTIIKVSFFFLSPNYPVTFKMGQGYRLVKNSMGSDIRQSSKYLSSIVAWEKVSVHILFLFVCLFQPTLYMHWKYSVISFNTHVKKQIPWT